MTYDQHYEKAKKEYDTLCEHYENYIDNPEYMIAVYEAPFSMMRTLYLANRIDLYTKAAKDKKPMFKFNSVQEAISTYHDILNYDKNIEDLLNQASLIVSTNEAAEAINAFVQKSVYLDNGLQIHQDIENKDIVSIATDCLTILPKCSKEITQDFKTSLLCEMMLQFEEPQIVLLASKGIFTPDDIPNILERETTSNDKFKKNLAVLCKGFHITSIPIQKFDVNLKGVTFNNDDGINRQEHLKELNNVISVLKQFPEITLVPNIFTPKVGDPEPSVSVYWGEKLLGFLPKDVAKALHEQYKDFPLSASIVKIVGGNDVTYGLTVHIDVYEPVKDIEQSAPTIE